MCNTTQLTHDVGIYCMISIFCFSHTYIYIYGWWFQTFFNFHNIWDNPSHWLMFFKMVKTTNQIYIYIYIFIGSAMLGLSHYLSSYNLSAYVQILASSYSGEHPPQYLRACVKTWFDYMCWKTTQGNHNMHLIHTPQLRRYMWLSKEV